MVVTKTLLKANAQDVLSTSLFCRRYVALECREDASSINLQLKNELKEIDQALLKGFSPREKEYFINALIVDIKL